MRIFRDGKEIELTCSEMWEAYNEIKAQNYRDYIEDRLIGEWKYDRLDKEEKARIVQSMAEEMMQYLIKYDVSDDSAFSSVYDDFFGEPVTMKIRDFIKQEIDIDVMGNIAIAFCGPLELTPEGIKYFSDILDLDIEIGDNEADVIADNSRLYDKAKEFFWWAAGYCTDELWRTYFKEFDE